MNKQQVIFITGTSTGFGRQLAEQLSKKGHYVYAAMRNTESKNYEVANELKAAAHTLKVVEVDVSSTEQVDAAVKRIIDEHGRIDVAINNAGIMNVGVTEGFNEKQLYTQMEANFFGPARIFRAVLPHMRKANNGLVITVTSLAGRIIIPGFTTYNTSKFAAEALAEGYRYELKPFNVDSVIVEPGPYKTKLISNSPAPEDEKVVSAYGEFGERLRSTLDGFNDFFDQDAEGLTNPQEVVETIIKLIETPYGKRPLRTVSGIDYGTRELNTKVSMVQHGTLKELGFDDLDSADVVHIKKVA